MSDELQQMRIRLADDLQRGAYVSDPLLVVNAIEALIRAIVREEMQPKCGTPGIDACPHGILISYHCAACERISLSESIQARYG